MNKRIKFIFIVALVGLSSLLTLPAYAVSGMGGPCQTTSECDQSSNLICDPGTNQCTSNSGGSNIPGVCADNASVSSCQKCSQACGQNLSSSACTQATSLCTSDVQNAQNSSSGTAADFTSCVNANSTVTCCAESKFSSQPQCASAGTNPNTPPPSTNSTNPNTTPPSSATNPNTTPPNSGSTSGCPDDTNYTKSPSGLCVPKSPFSGGLAGAANSITITDVIMMLLKWLLTFAGIAAVIFLIIGGYQYITSNGNEEQAEKGRKTITNAIIGLVVIVLSYTLVSVISNFLTKT